MEWKEGWSVSEWRRVSGVEGSARADLADCYQLRCAGRTIVVEAMGRSRDGTIVSTSGAGHFTDMLK